MKRRNLLIGLLFLCMIAGLQAQEKKPFTAESMSDPVFRTALSVPRVWWLKDNTAVIYDMRKPAAERVLERYYPGNNRRKPFLDIKKARENFKSLFEDEKAPAGLSPIPNSFSEDGKTGLYTISGDIYVIDIPKAEIVRVTDSEVREKNARLSPDGRKVAYVRDNNIFYTDLRTLKEYQLTFDGSETLLNGTLSWVYWEEIFGRQDIAFWWSGDSKAIAYLQTDESMVSVQSYVDIEPWTPTVTTQRYPKVGEANPDVRAGIVELATRKTTWMDFDRDYEYIIRVNWMPGDRRICVRTENRLQTELDFYFVDRISGEGKYIMSDVNEGWINMSDDIYFLDDNKHFIISSERDGYEHLYRFTMDGKLANQITKGEWSIRSSGGGPFWVRQAVCGIDQKRGWIYFTALKKHFLEKHLYRVRMDGSGLERVSRGEGTHRISMSPNTKYYLDNYSNIRTAPSMTLCLSSGKKRFTLAESMQAELDRWDIQYPELFQVPARDGFGVSCYMVKPKNPEPGRKYPVIVSVYGGPSAPQISNSFSRGVFGENLMLDEGYISMKIDNRAAMGISKKLENLLLKRTPGEVELNDLVDAVRQMKKKDYIDPDRWGITGWSGGGTNTILAMTRSKEFKAGIAGAGVTDFRFYDTAWGESAMKTEAENLDGYEASSLLKYAKDLHGKLMLVHGTHDDNVHIQNTWRFINELIKANKLFELMVYPMRKHGVSDPAGRRHLQTVRTDFWKRNL
jgi:dipeptidyl-peptidase-4